MAIIQISKIQQRSGNLVDLPQLSEAQLGWANDAKRLFIGTTTPNPNENVEVLTSYSDITFSQINGSEGNLNVSNAQNGQVLTYVASTNTWQNAGGNLSQPNNSALYSNTGIHLGNVNNVKMGGGVNGYVLQTDGYGNLSWTVQTGGAGSNLAAPGSNTQVLFNDGGNVGANSSLFYNKATDILGTPTLNSTGVITATRLVSNIATGTAPFTVTSTTQVANLNVATAGTATTAGTVTTNAQPNITSTGTLSSLTISANVATGGIKTDNYYYANGVAISFTGSYSNSNVANYLPTFTGTVGATELTTGANSTVGTITGNWGLSAGSKLTATYADLAEYYEADTHYEPGTILAFGGDKEVTIAEDGTSRVAGVVSTNPAYAMNANCKGIATAIALQGRVPTKVRGAIRKGDMMVSGGNGFARPSISPHMGTVIGKALENFDGIEGVIEVAVGRL